MNQAPAQTTKNLGLTPMEGFVMGIVAIFFAIGCLFYISGELSGILFKQDRPGASPSQIPIIAGRVLSSPGSPAEAWPKEAQNAVPGPVLYYLTFLILLIATIFAIKFGKDVWEGNKKRDPNSAQWARNKDIKSLIVPTPGIRGRLVLGRTNGKLIATEPRQSVIVMGPTQTGKTTGFAVPAILEWDGPVIAASVKNDLVKDTYKWRSKQGQVWLFDPTRATGFDYEDVRAGWSPLSTAIDWGGARKVASWLCKANKSASSNLSDGDFWFSAAEKMMSPYLFAAAMGGKDMATVLRWIDTNEEHEVKAILQRTGVSEAMTAFEANMKRDERTKSSIFTTAETIIDAYNDPLVCESAANPTIFSSELLNGGKNTLYICAPSHEQDRLQTIFTAIVSQMKSAAYELAGKQNRAVDPPLLICIDEAANIAPLEDLDAIASTAAGIGIQLVTIFQDMAQIEARYKERARTVINNHRAKVVLSGISDSGTLEYVSKLIGEEDVDQTSVNISAQGERSTTESKQQRTLASGSYLRRMKFGEGIVVYGQLAPAKLVLRPWYKDRVLKHLVEHGTKPGNSGGPAGSNSRMHSTTISKDSQSVPAMSAVPSDARYTSGDGVTNQMGATQMPIAPGTPGSVDPHVQPGTVSQTVSPPGASGELSAFDKALAELRARDAAQPQAAQPPAPAPGAVPGSMPPAQTFSPPSSSAPATPGAPGTPTTYTPGVPLYDDLDTSSSSASPKKWKPSGGGISEDSSTESSDGTGGFGITAPTEQVVPPIVPETIGSAETTAGSSKWSKGSKPAFKDSKITEPTIRSEVEAITPPPVVPQPTAPSQPTYSKSAYSKTPPAPQTAAQAESPAPPAQTPPPTTQQQIPAYEPPVVPQPTQPVPVQPAVYTAPVEPTYPAQPRPEQSQPAPPPPQPVQPQAQPSPSAPPQQYTPKAGSVAPTHVVPPQSPQPVQSAPLYEQPISSQPVMPVSDGVQASQTDVYIQSPPEAEDTDDLATQEEKPKWK